MTKSYKEVLSDMAPGGKALLTMHADTMKTYSEFGNAVMKDDALTKKTKELVALGIGIAVRCEGCIVSHVRNLIKLGVTKEEISEVCMTAIYMGGGPSHTYATYALAAFDELSQG